MTRSILIGTSSFATVKQKPLKKIKDNEINIINNPLKRKIKKNELIDLLTEDVMGLIVGLETLDDEVLTKSHLKIY